MMNTGKMVMQEKYFHTQIPNFRNMTLKMTAPNLENVVETSVDILYYLSLKLKNFLLLTSFCSAIYLER